ncbi:hypothetical protein AOL_s00110g196 [Orbilia oligospora ATCC 24927]|uniref:Uncharacterized protein n=1 Tax=Arthrobotrys oligospora (strain ATCC 24927 / CBS 115.81 / DSM 1491) TaxID=756982 RepID=G1XL26_ARTOA|nr:hypothetical protein AOL_s00110g196 [Orbilia oligospora ATCC 24927]EGX46032.1 hypothetical protein AOL_s00110g196 [Orbilia oligospora ATCC 24927]
MDRDTPDAIIWDTISPSTEFRKNVLVKYKVKEFQIQAQLSVPLAVTPQICGAVTFAKDNYVITNSIDQDSIIAMDLVAAAVLLIYDESRGVHRTFDGADLIEMCCIQSLRDIGYDFAYLPQFSNPDALSRLQTWYYSNFVSLTRKYFTGDQLIRQATRRISEMIEAARVAVRDNSTLPYWALEDFLRTGSIQAFKPPRFQDTSWHILALAAPPIILVVGELKPDFFHEDGLPPSWPSSNAISKINTLLKSFGLGKVLQKYCAEPRARGGIFGSHRTLRRWLIQVQSFSGAYLRPADNHIVYNLPSSRCDCAYDVFPLQKGDNRDNKHLFGGCPNNGILLLDGK